MNRRTFLRTSAGVLATLAPQGCYVIHHTPGKPRAFKFRPYQPDTSLGRIQIVSPDDGYYLHTFYDVCPFSPSQRYLAVNRFPYQDHDAVFGDTADICVIDLQNETFRVLYSTRGWGFQLGANLNWGKTDRHLYTNDVINHKAVCVRLDLETGETVAFDGPMYHIAPDESAVVGFPLDLINVTQMGYGVPDFGRGETIVGAPGDQGIWRTDLTHHKTRLLLSLKDAAAKSDDPEYLENGNCYFFHSKYNAQGTRILQVMRCLFPDHPEKKGWNPMLLTMNSDGTALHTSVSRRQWSVRGNHPNWHPDGEHIIMNLAPHWLGESRMLFCMVHHSGSGFRILSEQHLGSGHPSVTPDSRWLLSDYYAGEYPVPGATLNPLRLIHLSTQEERAICTLRNDMGVAGTLRLDPHPVWSRDYRKVCFNAAPDGKRQVLVADLEGQI